MAITPLFLGADGPFCPDIMQQVAGNRGGFLRAAAGVRLGSILMDFIPLFDVAFARGPDDCCFLFPGHAL
jgi:hypothetical protein